MGQVDRLSLEFVQNGKDGNNTVECAWRGYKAQFTRIAEPVGYDFRWTGEQNYLALHDLVLADGEMTVDGLGAISGRDLRDKLTYVPQGCAIEGWAKPMKRANSFTALYFDTEAIEGEAREIFQTNAPAPHVYFESAPLRSTLQKIQAELKSSERSPGVYGETLGLLAALEVWRQQNNARPRNDDRSSKLSVSQEKRVLDYIEANYASDINLAELADIAGLSRFHFARQFKLTTGHPPHQFLSRHRVERAKEMLAASSLDVSEIAAATGFGSDSNFIRSFRSVTGSTPARYRKSIG